MDTAYVKLRNTIPEKEGRREALESIEASATGFLNNLRDFDIQRNQESVYLSQKCAENWTDICDVYLGNLQPNSVDKFLTSAARRKYCAMPKEQDGCKYTCVPVNPTYPDSPQACSWQGLNTYYTGDGPVVGGEGCQMKHTQQLSCDDSMICKMPDRITLETDPVIQRCMLYNSCNDFFSQLRDSPISEKNDSIPKPYVQTFNDPQFYPDMSAQGYFNEKNGRYCNSDILKNELQRNGSADCVWTTNNRSTTCVCTNNCEIFKATVDHRACCNCLSCTGKGCNCCKRCMHYGKWSKNYKKVI